jgi:hypothetical protein
MYIYIELVDNPARYRVNSHVDFNIKKDNQTYNDNIIVLKHDHETIK